MNDPAKEDRKAVLARIHGTVQGVWYRDWTVQTASALGLSGWVRNRSDETVEALFAGPTEAVDRMLAACREGPPKSAVSDIKVEPTVDPGPIGFERRSTL
jgi:acylphosphatase